MRNRFKALVAGCSFALAAAPGVADEHGMKELSGAQEDLQEAMEVVQQMKQETDLRDSIAQAKGIFIVPDYATAALLVGGSGGEGVLFKNQDGTWSNPLFYDVGSLSIGAQAGISAGSIAMLLMSDEAVESFNQENNFSLDAQAGLTIINWSAKAEASAGKGDVVVWADTEGLLAEAAIAVSDINFDEEESREYYNDDNLTLEALFAGDVTNPHASELQTEFAEFSTH